MPRSTLKPGGVHGCSPFSMTENPTLSFLLPPSLSISIPLSSLPFGGLSKPHGGLGGAVGQGENMNLGPISMEISGRLCRSSFPPLYPIHWSPSPSGPHLLFPIPLWTSFIVPYPPLDSIHCSPYPSGPHSLFPIPLKNLGYSECSGWWAVLEDPHCEDPELQDGAEGMREVLSRPLPV